MRTKLGIWAKARGQPNRLADYKTAEKKMRASSPVHALGQIVEFQTSLEADQARTKLVGLLRAGKSDREILDTFIRRYGERILSEPEGAKWIVLTAVPTVTLLFGSLFVRRFVIRHRRRESCAVEENGLELGLDWDRN